jgi:hypothetical protein
MFFSYLQKIKLYLAALLILAVALGLRTVFAVDGSGTNTVAPTSAIRSSTGNVLTFTFTANELMDSGGIGITVPSGWSAPQGINGSAGYTVVNSTGIVADVRNNLDVATNWFSSNHMALSIDTSDKQEGTGSLVNAIGGTAAGNEQWYFNYGANTNWGGTSTGNLRVGFWMESSVATAAGDLSWQDSGSTNLTSPLDTISIPAVPASVWTYNSVSLTAATRTAIRSYGVRHTNAIGADTVKIDSISTIFHDADLITRWSGDNGITPTLLNTSGNFKEGTGAVRCAYAGSARIGANGDCFFNASAAYIIGPGTTISFWIRSSIALNAGDFAWTDDGTQNVGSPEDIVNLPALSANTWTYITLTAANSANKNTRSFGLRQLVDKGAMTIDIDAMGKQIDNCNAISNWTAPSANTLALSTSSATKHEGTGSLQNIISSSVVNGDYWYEDLGSAANWSGYTTVGFWINPTVATSAGDIQFQYSNSVNLASPIASLNLSALSANAWTYQKLTLSGTRTSILSYGFKYNANVGVRTIYIDDILLGPGSPIFAGQTINARTLALTNPQTITVVYGNGGGASGATATNTVGNSVFTTQSRISDGGILINIVSSPVVLVTDVASVFVLNNPSSITAGTRAAYTVTRKDSLGNPVTIGPTTANLTSSSTGLNKKFYDAASGGNVITSVTIPNGASTANFWYYDEFAGTWTITASQTGFTPGTNNQVVNPAAATTLFLNSPGPIASGTRAAYTVTRKDSFGNLVISGTISVNLSSNSTGNKAFYDAASGGNIITSINIMNGSSSVNFWYYDDKPGTWTITAASVPLTQATDSIVVTTSVTKFVIVDPVNGIVDNPITITIQAVDNSGNIDVSYTNSVTLNVSGSATGGGVVTITNGIGTKNIIDNVAETVTLSLTDSQSTGLDVSSIKSAVFAPGAVKKFLLNHPGTIAAGNRAAYTITREDQFNNPVVSGADSVYLYSSSGSVNKNFYDAAIAGNIIASVSISDTSSLANFWYFDDMPGTYTITASDNVATPDGATGIIDATDSLVVDVIPAVAVKLVILPPTGNTVGNPVIVTIQAQKSDNSVDTTYTNTVTLNTSGSATGGGLVNIINGVGTRTITDSVAETVNLSLTDFSLTGLDVSSTQSIIFSAAAVSKFILNNPGDMIQGTRLGYIVTREDVSNNPITTGTTTVYLYSSSTSANSKFYDAATGTNVIQSIDITAGNSTTSFWYYDDTPGTYVITVSDNATAPDGSAGIADAARSVIVSPAVVTPTKFIMTLSVNTAQVNAPVTVTVKAVDNGNNVATSFNGSVTLSVSGSATGGGVVALASGIGIKTVSDAVVETISLSLQDTASTGLDISATAGISFTAAPPAPPPIVPTVSAGYFRADIAFRGKAFPGAKVVIIYLDTVNNKVNTLTESTVTSPAGDFEIRFNNLTERGFYSYALTVTDKDGHSVQTQSYRLDVAGAFLEEDIIMSPTISVLREAVSRGDFVTIQGYATPQSKIDFTIDRQSFNYDTTVDASGFYKILFNTANLDFGSHSVQTRQRLTDSRLSASSPQALFNVSQLFTVKTDLNNDGVVDVKDLSIFLSFWSSIDINARKKIDFNNDGVADIKDFSIFVRTIKR